MAGIKNIKPDYKSSFHQSYYIAVNKDKCKSNTVICRSLLEKRFSTYLDLNENIKYWYSEAISIKYINQWDKKEHLYYPDFIFESVNGEKVIVEVKPYRQLQKPKEPKNKTKKAIENYKTSLKMYITNMSKVQAAKSFAEANGYKFILVTEKDLDKLYK